MTSSSSSDLTLKLIVHKPTQRVMFVEANRDSVNFLFGPPAFTLKPVTGSDGGHDVFAPKEDSIFHPAIEILGGHDRPSLPNEDVPKAKKLKGFTFEGDYGSATQPFFYLITGELVVKQWSLISCLEILDDFHVVQKTEIEEVSLEATEFLRLVEMGLECEDVLTSVLLALRGERKF